MDPSSLASLIRLSSVVQIGAVALVFLGGALQATRFLLDRKTNTLKESQSQIDQAQERLDPRVVAARGMISVRLTRLTRLNSLVQVVAVALVLLGGAFQVRRFRLDSRISDLKERESQAEKQMLTDMIEEQSRRIQEQARQVDTMQRAMLETEARVRPRAISDQMYAELREELSSRAGDSIEIACVAGDGEGLAFATRLNSLFRDAGWTVDGVTQITFMGPVQGVIITISDTNVAPKAQYIHDILGIAGFEARAIVTQPPKFDLAITVGRKE